MNKISLKNTTASQTNKEAKSEYLVDVRIEDIKINQEESKTFMNEDQQMIHYDIKESDEANFGRGSWRLIGGQTITHSPKIHQLNNLVMNCLLYLTLLLLSAMNEVLEQIYRKHRKSLQYPEHFLNPAKFKNKPQLTPRLRETKQLQYLHNLKRKSVDLDQRHLQPPTKSFPTKVNNTLHLSTEQEQAIKKYKVDYTPLQNKPIFPPIRSYRNSSRKSSSREVHEFSSQRYSIGSENLEMESEKKTNKQTVEEVGQRIQLLAVLSNNLLNSINKLINKHYSDVLKYELTSFSNILKTKIIRPEADLTEKVVNNLVDITLKLKETNIRKDILTFLTLVTLQNSPLPSDFFTEYQIMRLQFQEEQFQLKNMNEPRVKMIVGIFMGIKILVEYIFMRPWEIKILGITENAQDKIQAILWAYSSYINCAILEYFRKLPKHSKEFLEEIKAKGVKPLKNAKIDDQFFNGVCINYKKQYHQINSNIIAWINRITHQVLKWHHNYK